MHEGFNFSTSLPLHTLLISSLSLSSGSFASFSCPQFHSILTCTIFFLHVNQIVSSLMRKESSCLEDPQTTGSFSNYWLFLYLPMSHVSQLTSTSHSLNLEENVISPHNSIVMHKLHWTSPFWCIWPCWSLHFPWNSSLYEFLYNFSLLVLCPLPWVFSQLLFLVPFFSYQNHSVLLGFFLRSLSKCLSHLTPSHECWWLSHFCF